MPPNRCGAKRECVCKGKTPAERFKQFHTELKMLEEATDKERQDILKKAHPCLIRLICEIGLNILKGTLQLPEHQYANLKPHKRLLLSLSRKGIPLQTKRNILVKKLGGFLPKVLPALLSGVSSLTGHLIANSLNG